MRSKLSLFLPFGIGGILPFLLALSSYATPVQRVVDFVPRSEFIFTGTILQTRTSTIDAQNVDDLAVVRVDEIITATRPFGSLRSAVITIRLANPQSAKKGQKRVFFTRGWHFGSSIAVIEVGQTEAVSSEAVGKMRSEIKHAQKEQTEKTVKERLSETELIVSGRVLKIRESDVPMGLTEHDPNWHEAEIRIEKILKGNITQRTVTIMFSKSDDVMWYQAPKFETGAEGLWLLRPFVFGGQKLKYPAVVDSKDFYPKADLPMIERLLGQQREIAPEIMKFDPEVIERFRLQGWPYHYELRYGLARVSVINMIPNYLSDETGQDSEPNLAVDPTTPDHIVGSAFTRNPTGETDSAPVFVSTDRGNTWWLNNIVPSGNGMTGDISIDFGRRDHTLYTGILRGGSYLRQILLRSANPFIGTMMEVLTDHNTELLDQPYVSATTFDDAGTNRDRVYVGFNEYDNRSGAGGTGRTASAEYSLDARTAAPPAGFATTRVEARNTAAQDMPAVRYAVHDSGVVYGIFYRWQSGNVPSAVCDVIVVRDDNFAAGANPFTDLDDPGDNIAGRIVVSGRTVPAFPASLGQNRLVASNLSVAVHPNSPATVYIAWADRVGTTDYTLHVRRSTDSGANWSNDLLTITDATNPALAINSSGQVGFLYQELTGTAPNQRWETHFRRTSSGTSWSDLVLADTSNSSPAAFGQPYIGDYADLLAVGRTFYGVFSASNYPDLANFPQGVTYQRKVDFTNKQLRDFYNTIDVNISIDPFFFSVTPPTIFDICKIKPFICDGVQLDRNRIIIEVGKIPVIVIDPLPKNCLVKWQCPGCDGRTLCPAYHHIFIEDIDLREWKVTLFGPRGTHVRHQVSRHGNGLVLSFRPHKKFSKEKNIGDYTLIFEGIGKLSQKRYVFPTRLETSDFPFVEHMKRRQEPGFLKR